MKQITNISNDANQTLTAVLDDGSKLFITLNYKSNQQGWFYSMKYGTFILNNRRLVLSPNLLRQFRGIISFGIACNVNDGYEPVYIEDFSTGRVSLYVLDSTDIATAETVIESHAS